VENSDAELGTLSIKELARRADFIELRLNKGFEMLETSNPHCKSYKERQQDIMTKVFIGGSLIFLHTVTSGLLPNLPEIRQGVMKTLDALENMRKHSEINIPSWPYCMAGCLALESEHERVRALYPPPKKDTHPLVTTRWTLDIIEECWKARKTQKEGTETCHWITAMSHLGTRLLLL
jgi:hypothetical protein